MQTPESQLEALSRGTAKILSENELLTKLRLGRPLNVKLGVDPTAPDIHLGFTVCLEKLRQFQQLGHQAVLIIGDFTAMIGDPSGRSKTRPQLSREEVLRNAESFREQAFKILDREKTKVVFNGDWFSKMSFVDVIRLNSRVTLQQMLHREDFRNRVERGDSVRLHEVQYPIIQGWDSVMVQADVELGGTDQLFNILVGRDLQREEGQPEQVVMLMPLLEGLVGVNKMSKSLNNYVGVSEPPVTMFGKLGHPMDAKKELARRLVERYHGSDAGAEALADFNTRFSKKNLDDADLPNIAASLLSTDILSAAAAAYQTGYQITRSRSDLRRLVEQGSIQLRSEKITDPKAVLSVNAGDILRLDKTRAVRAIEG